MSAPRLGRPGVVRFPGRPGRPRTRLADGHDSGHEAEGDAQPRAVTSETGQETGAGVRHTTDASPAVALEPRLVSVADAARYLAVGETTVRGWIAAGQLVPVSLPGPGGGRLGRVLLEREALDRFVAEWAGRT